MQNSNFKYPDTAAFNFVVERLESRGVELRELSNLAYEMQKDFAELGTPDEYYEALIDVLHKRELLNDAMVALELDRLAQTNQLAEPLLSIVKNDAGVFGADEALALGIANIYGTIGVTNYGYLDRVKKDVIKRFDENDDQVATFIDDILGAIVAAVCGKMAHRYA